MQRTLAAWTTAAKKRPGPRIEKEAPVREPSLKKFKSFHIGGTGGEVSEEVRTKVHDKLAPLDAIQNIRRRSKKRGEKKKLTPVHKQIFDIKQEHPDTLLLVEEGYKYKAFAADAAIVSQILGFYLSDGRLEFVDDHEDEYDAFATCSFPDTSLRMHLQKLVERGHKVGIVQQMEKAALKKSGKPMERALTKKYTKATFVDEVDEKGETAAEANYLMVLRELDDQFGLVAIDATTGDIVWDAFAEDLMLTGLETRLMHLQPVEILFVGEISDQAKRLVTNVANIKDGIVAMKDAEPSFDSSVQLTEFFVDELDKAKHNSKAQVSATFDWAANELPSVVQDCLVAAIDHLKEFELSRVFTIQKNYKCFNERAEMYLSGDTLASLNIFDDNESGEGSLFEILDNTRTSFGKRLLRNWVAKPLQKLQEIQRRQEAVAELAASVVRGASCVAEQLKYCPDLEKCLANVIYRRSSRPQLYRFLKKLESIVTIEEPMRCKSELLSSNLQTFPKYRETVVQLCKYIDDRWSEVWLRKKEDCVEMFLDIDSLDDDEHDLLIRRMDVQQTEEQLAEHLKHLKQELKVPLVFTTHNDQSYFIEIETKHKSKIPTDWDLHGKTKKTEYYRSPTCRQLFAQLEKNKALLEQACTAAYGQFLDKVASESEKLRDIIKAAAELDCLMSLSELARRSHYVRPTLVKEPGIKVTSGRHPIVEHWSLTTDFIANNVDISPRTNRMNVITGPNMGGKSTYVRQVALIAILAQIGSYVPADDATIGPFDAVFTRMGAQDNMIRGQSTFKVELQECGNIMDRATERSLVILDEVGRGTSTIDGYAIASAVLDYFLHDIACSTMFITHYPELAKLDTQNTACLRMGFANEGGIVRFTYALEHGVAQRSYGLNVARIAGVPSEVIDNAREKSDELAYSHKPQLLKFIADILQSREISADRISQILAAIET